MSKSVAVTLAAEAVVLLLLLTTALDLYAHNRVEMLDGVNRWGYRGAVARHREPQEVRIVFVGGSRAFARGMPATHTTPAVLPALIVHTLDHPGASIPPIAFFKSSTSS